MGVNAMEEKCGSCKSLGHRVEPEEAMPKFRIEFN